MNLLYFPFDTTIISLEMYYFQKMLGNGRGLTVGLPSPLDEEDGLPSPLDEEDETRGPLNVLFSNSANTSLIDADIAEQLRQRVAENSTTVPRPLGYLQAHPESQGWFLLQSNKECRGTRDWKIQLSSAHIELRSTKLEESERSEIMKSLEANGINIKDSEVNETSSQKVHIVLGQDNILRFPRRIQKIGKITLYESDFGKRYSLSPQAGWRQGLTKYKLKEQGLAAKKPHLTDKATRSGSKKGEKKVRKNASYLRKGLCGSEDTKVQSKTTGSAISNQAHIDKTVDRTPQSRRIHRKDRALIQRWKPADEKVEKSVQYQASLLNRISVKIRSITENEYKQLHPQLIRMNKRHQELIEANRVGPEKKEQFSEEVIVAAALGLMLSKEEGGTKQFDAVTKALLAPKDKVRDCMSQLG